jgi:periplasmic divalent cation tolerance protein
MGYALATDFIVVLVTTKDKVEAEKISRTLLSEKLIACANIISPVNSCFSWLGKIDHADECLVIMKTRSDLFGELAARVRALHSYEVPEVLALPILDGSGAYLDWMRANLKADNVG